MSKENSYPKILPPTGMLVAVLFMLGLHFLFPSMRVVPGIWRFLGFLPLGFGLLISYASEKQFHQAGTTVQPFEESSNLVTNGWYRISRNPMYLGMILILTGIAILMGSLSPFLVIPVFALLMNHIFVEVEEKMLAEKFGEVWMAYKSRVRRWI